MVTSHRCRPPHVRERSAYQGTDLSATTGLLDGRLIRQMNGIDRVSPMQRWPSLKRLQYLVALDGTKFQPRRQGLPCQ